MQALHRISTPQLTFIRRLTAHHRSLSRYKPANRDALPLHRLRSKSQGQGAPNVARSGQEGVRSPQSLSSAWLDSARLGSAHPSSFLSLDILQTYYCERLGRAICVDIPGFFWAFYKLVGPFVDPRTKEKIRFLEKSDATSLIPPSQLQKQFGGDIDLQYVRFNDIPVLINVR